MTVFLYRSRVSLTPPSSDCIWAIRFERRVSSSESSILAVECLVTDERSAAAIAFDRAPICGSLQILPFRGQSI